MVPFKYNKRLLSNSIGDSDSFSKFSSEGSVLSTRLQKWIKLYDQGSSYIHKYIHAYIHTYILFIQLLCLCGSLKNVYVDHSKLGYMKRLKQVWSEKHPELSHLTGAPPNRKASCRTSKKD